MAGDLRVLYGRMRHRLVVTTMASAQETTLGSWVATSTTNSTRWASIEPITGRERLRSGQQVPDATHLIRMRYNTAVTPSDTLVKGSRTFEVMSAVNLDERSIILECMCKELVAN